MTQLATFGVMIFFVGFIVSNIWLIYEEPQDFEYDYDEYEEYEKDHAEYEHAVRGTMGVGRVLSGIGLIMLGGALFAGGISESTIPENIRRAMVHGGALIIIMTLFVMMLFAWIVV
ncbi:MAG: hypothetical protein L0Z54_00300 [Thermoplasmata archaeon]|nr:hypothetical protein [Thermoplasmata archaeon]